MTVAVAALGSGVPGEGDDRDAQGHVDREDPPPRGVVDHPATDHRADRGRHPRQAGPRADRGRPVLVPERRLDQRQRAGRQQCGADPLEHAQRDELAGALGGGAQRGRHEEPRDPDEVDPSPPEPVAEGAADEHERGQGEQVAVDHPLQLGQRGAEVAPDGAQRDVDHRPVEDRDPRAEGDAGQHEPAAGGGAVEHPGSSGGGSRGLGHRATSRTTGMSRVVRRT